MSRLCRLTDAGNWREFDKIGVTGVFELAWDCVLVVIRATSFLLSVFNVTILTLLAYLLL